MSVQRNKWVQTCHYIEKELGIDFETANKFLYGLVKGSYYQDLRNINVQKFREYVEDHIYYIKQYNFPIIT
jgi:queuine/archaeosine tRNA-ribosyltransferase